MPGATDALARFICDTPAEAIPEAAFERAAKAIVDTLGCTLLGNASEVREPLFAYLERSGDRGSRPVLGSDRCASAALAALVNGTFCHSEDYDDVLSMMPAHPSGIVLAALLAAPPERLSGRALLDAHIIGVEVGARIGLAIGNGHYRRGWHATGTLAIFCAVAALARAHRLERGAVAQLFGLAASMASGLRANFGTMTKPFHAGWAAHNAVVALGLVESGFSAAADVMENKAGFFAAYGTEQSNFSRGLERLGHPFAILDPGLALKKYPCSYPLHRAIDAMLALRHSLGLSADNTAEVTCRVAPGALRILTFDRPQTGLQAKFSMDYVLAAGILDGRFDCAAFSDAAVRREALQPLYARVRKIEEPRLLGGDAEHESRSSGTIGVVEVTARRSDGAEETVTVARPTGSPEHELTWADLAEKFADCARQAGFETVEAGRAFSAWRGVAEAPDVAALVALLRPGNAAS